MKKFVAVILGIMLILPIFCFGGCNNEDSINYECEIEFSMFSPNSEPIVKTFTKDETELELDIVYPYSYADCSLVYRVYENTNGEKALSKKALAEIDFEDLNYPNIIDYKVINNEQEESQRFIHKNFFYNPDSNLSVLPKKFRLPVKEGLHSIKLKTPKFKNYSVESFECEIKLNTIKDERTKTISLSMKEQSETLIYSKQAVDGEVKYDFYTFEKGLPIFVAKDSQTNEIVDENSLYTSFYRIDSNGYFTVWDFNYVRDNSGLYLCEIFFINNEIYQDSSYSCFVLIP